MGMPCSRKQLWVSGEGSQRAATCYFSHSHPLPNSLAHLSCGMVWLEYLMLMQAAFPPSYGKNVCALPRHPAFHPWREYPKIRLFFF